MFRLEQAARIQAVAWAGWLAHDLPEGLDPSSACLVEPTAVAWHTVRLAGAGPNDVGTIGGTFIEGATPDTPNESEFDLLIDQVVPVSFFHSFLVGLLLILFLSSLFLFFIPLKFKEKIKFN